MAAGEDLLRMFITGVSAIEVERTRDIHVILGVRSAGCPVGPARSTWSGSQVDYKSALIFTVNKIILNLLPFIFYLLTFTLFLSFIKQLLFQQSNL